LKREDICPDWKVLRYVPDWKYHCLELILLPADLKVGLYKYFGAGGYVICGKGAWYVLY
jgi:hypothetical protein